MDQYLSLYELFTLILSQTRPRFPSPEKSTPRQIDVESRKTLFRGPEIDVQENPFLDDKEVHVDPNHIGPVLDISLENPFLDEKLISAKYIALSRAFQSTYHHSVVMLRLVFLYRQNSKFSKLLNLVNRKSRHHAP